MALPNDMTVVQVVLLKEDVKRIDDIARSKRQSRSRVLGSIITERLASFSLSNGFSKELKESTENQSA
jgi:hypothetical protein